MKLETSGLTFLEDSEWRNKRKLINNAFNFEFLSKFFDVEHKLVIDKFNEMETFSDEKLKSFDFLPFSTTITGEIAIAFFYGIDYCRVKVDGRMLTEVVL